MLFEHGIDQSHLMLQASQAPSTNRAQCAVTSFMRRTTLATTPGRQPTQLDDARSIYNEAPCFLSDPCAGQTPLGPVPRNFFVTSWRLSNHLDMSRWSGLSLTSSQLPRGLVTKKLATSPTSPRGSYEELVPVEFGRRGSSTRLPTAQQRSPDGARSSVNRR